MATIQIHIPEELWARLQQTGRPVEEVVVEALERSLKASDSQTPSKGEIIQRLVESGIVRDPEELATPAAKRWEELPEQEKEEHLREATETYLPDSPASRAVIRNRRRWVSNLTREEVAQRLIKMGLVRDPNEWNTLAARRWAKLSELEQVASAVLVEELSEIEVTFVSGDKQALRTAQLEALDVDNPFDHVGDRETGGEE